MLNPEYDAAKAALQETNMRTRTLSDLENRHAGFVSPDFDPENQWWGSNVAVQD